MCKDGQHSLKGRLALFYARNRSCEADFYLRSATVHNQLLDVEQVPRPHPDLPPISTIISIISISHRSLPPHQVRREHAMLEELLLEDAIAAIPPFLRPPLERAHAEAPFGSTRELRERAAEVQRAAIDAAEQLWQAPLALPPSSRPISPDLAKGGRCRSRSHHHG